MNHNSNNDAPPFTVIADREYRDFEKIDGATLRRWAKIPKNKKAAAALLQMAGDMEATAGVARDAKPVPVAVASEAFSARQMTLFQDLAGDGRRDRGDLSNHIVFWDCVPRYSVSATQMKKLRINGQFLGTYTRAFRHDGKDFMVRIQPCLVEERMRVEKGGDPVLRELAYYPSGNEELVEEALRKMTTEKNAGFYDALQNPHRGGVVFTLYELTQELKRMGHSRTYAEIKKSLHILAHSVITISEPGTTSSDLPNFGSSGYFSTLGRFHDGDGDEGRSKWVVGFHPLVVDSINNLAYRQFNYAQLMQLSSQLSRWFLRVLTAKYTFASRLHDFVMELGTIRRDSGLLDGYTRLRAAHEACQDALNELKEHNILRNFTFEPEYGYRRTLSNVKYSLSASPTFIQDVFSANNQINRLREQKTKV